MEMEYSIIKLKYSNFALNVYLPIYLIIYLSINLFIYLFINSFTYLLLTICFIAMFTSLEFRFRFVYVGEGS